ncbi:hypothetical protein U1Q18_040874 [Sarracenia purpurea var. burkii]
MGNQCGFESYVVIHNFAKRQHIGTMAWSATVFGVSEMILVGHNDFNAFVNHGSTSHLRGVGVRRCWQRHDGG